MRILSAQALPKQLHKPYWRLEETGHVNRGMFAVARRLSMAVRPLAGILRRAAPVSSIVVIVSQLLGGGATVWALLLTTHVLGMLLSGGANTSRLQATLPLLLLLGGVYLIRLSLDAATSTAKAHLVPKVHRAAEEELLSASLLVNLASFDDPGFYDQLHRARDRGMRHIEGAAASLVDALTAVFSVAGAALALALLHPVLLLILVLALLPEGWAALNAARLQYAGMPTTISLIRQVRMMAELATQREFAPEIRANQAQEYVFSEYRRSSMDLQNHTVSLGLAEARSMALGRSLSGLGVVGVFVALCMMVQAQWLNLAVAGTAVIAIRSASAALAGLMRTAHELFEHGLYISDYREFVETARKRSRPAGDIVAPENPGRIELTQVGFSYPGTADRMAVHGVSLSIEQGQTIALVGENGSGKTTLAKLVAGLYHPTEGRITWAGIDLKDMTPDTLADRVVMVLQDPIRWPRSARDNIRLGRYKRSDPDGNALLDAAQQSHALEVIETLSDGWETLLSQQFRGGQDLSGGQWQRLAVARGLYRDAPLVIWDEPTAPLDAKAEHAVYESLRKLARNRTVILITHRLASVRNADRIFFMERGTLVEQGRHEELLGMNGRYAELYRLQTRLHGLQGAGA